MCHKRAITVAFRVPFEIVCKYGRAREKRSNSNRFRALSADAYRPRLIGFRSRLDVPVGGRRNLRRFIAFEMLLSDGRTRVATTKIDRNILINVSTVTVLQRRSYRPKKRVQRRRDFSIFLVRPPTGIFGEVYPFPGNRTRKPRLAGARSRPREFFLDGHFESTVFFSPPAANVSADHDGPRDPTQGSVSGPTRAHDAVRDAAAVAFADEHP